MNAQVPLSRNEYREIPFDIYASILSSYFWLNSDFSICYRFMLFPKGENATGRLWTIRAADPAHISLDEYYAVEYNLTTEQLFITFSNDRYRVESIRAYYGHITAIILHLISSDEKSHFFYSAVTDPFNPDHRKVYGI